MNAVSFSAAKLVGERSNSIRAIVILHSSMLPYVYAYGAVAHWFENVEFQKNFDSTVLFRTVTQVLHNFEIAIFHEFSNQTGFFFHEKTNM